MLPATTQGPVRTIVLGEVRQADIVNVAVRADGRVLARRGEGLVLAGRRDRLALPVEATGEGLSMGQSHLRPLRYTGARVLVGIFMLNTIVLAVAGVLLDSLSASLVTAMGAALSILPAIGVFLRRRRIDTATRIAVHDLLRELRVA